MNTNNTLYNDATLQAAIDEAMHKVNTSSGSLVSQFHYPNTFPLEAPARLALARALLSRLPEPKPPTADGKTPGQVAFEAWAPNYVWEAAIQEDWHLAASAVLAAFGQASLEIGIKRMEDVPNDDLYFNYSHAVGGVSEGINAIRAHLIDAARGYQPSSQLCGGSKMTDGWRPTYNDPDNSGMHPEVEPCPDCQPSSQPSEIPWIEWNGGECPLKDEEVVEWGFCYREELGLKDIIEVCDSKPSGMRWGHEGNCSDIIAYRVTKWREGQPAAVDWQARAEKAEAELAQVQNWKAQQLQVESEWDCQMLAKKLGVGIGQSCRAGIQKTVLAMLEQPNFSQLRPLSEAGPVPEGCVRIRAWTHEGTFRVSTLEDLGDTHFVDVRLPAPAVDTYAELKEAHVAGKVIQYNCGSGDKPEWEDVTDPEFSDGVATYRIKPESIFEAHGQTWTKHDGGPMPCDGGAIVQVLLACEKAKGMLGEASYCASHWVWTNNLDMPCFNVVGWRYADKPKAEPSLAPLPHPWQPAVGDVVRLRSGGPAMTVLDPEENGEFWCAWFAEETLLSQDFPAACLTPAKEE